MLQFKHKARDSPRLGGKLETASWLVELALTVVVMSARARAGQLLARTNKTSRAPTLYQADCSLVQPSEPSERSERSEL